MTNMANQSKIKILVVEDENIVAKDLINTLEKLGYEVVGHANKYEKAIELAKKEKPDIILMDIMLKGEKTGIDAAKMINKELNIPVIYLTAYADKDTLEKAKITEPYAYIIKPYKEVDIKTAIELSLYKFNKDKKLSKERDLLYQLVHSKDSGNKYIFVKNRSRYVKINVEDILFIEALKDYVIIVTKKEKYIVHSTMKDILSKLPSDKFVRVHRSYIVNIDHIKAIDSLNIILNEHMKYIPIGNAFKDELFKKINLV
jgi:DNA-binding LytR/AlgR family response regulator